MIGGVKSNASVSGTVSSKTVIADTKPGRIIVNHVTWDLYEGPYEITPTIEPQSFLTDHLRVDRNLSVLGIPYYEEKNEAGGITAYIGIKPD
jgi:hypothetical protein